METKSHHVHMLRVVLNPDIKKHLLNIYLYRDRNNE